MKSKDYWYYLLITLIATLMILFMVFSFIVGIEQSAQREECDKIFDCKERNLCFSDIALVKSEIQNYKLEALLCDLEK